MINLEESLNIILNNKLAAETELVSVLDSMGRILAQDICSKIDIPSFNRAAMDGFAINSADKSESFKIIEVINAGKIPEYKINIGECAKICTGATVPEGANKVIRYEYVEEKDDYITIVKDDSKNIALKGENIKVGDKILCDGTLIRSQEISSLSALGVRDILVYKQPLIGVIATGSELISAGEEYKPSKVYDSNGPQICSKMKAIPAKYKYYGIVKDDETLIDNLFKKASAECDIVVISGGAGKSDFDFAAKILKKNNIDVKIEEIAIQPGKPVIFGEKDNKYFFGLSGNPVSSFLAFELFLKPFIYKKMNHDYNPLWIDAIAFEDIKVKSKAKRAVFKPVRFDGKYVYPVEYTGSGHITALLSANGFILFELGVSEYKKGETVSVRQI